MVDTGSWPCYVPGVEQETDEMTKDRLIEAIKQAKYVRYCDEMSDDYCYSNSKYDRHTRHINQLEVQLAEMERAEKNG